MTSQSSGGYLAAGLYFMPRSGVPRHRYTPICNTLTRVWHKAYQDGMKESSSSASAPSRVIVDLAMLLKISTSYYQIIGYGMFWPFPPNRPTNGRSRNGSTGWRLFSLNRGFGIAYLIPRSEDNESNANHMKFICQWPDFGNV